MEIRLVLDSGDQMVFLTVATQQIHFQAKVKVVNGVKFQLAACTAQVGGSQKP